MEAAWLLEQGGLHVAPQEPAELARPRHRPRSRPLPRLSLRRSRPPRRPRIQQRPRPSRPLARRTPRRGVGNPPNDTPGEQLVRIYRHQLQRAGFDPDAILTNRRPRRVRPAELQRLTAGWAPDPTGLHEWRWWNGARWTAAVTNPQTSLARRRQSKV